MNFMKNLSKMAYLSHWKWCKAFDKIETYELEVVVSPSIQPLSTSVVPNLRTEFPHHHRHPSYFLLEVEVWNQRAAAWSAVAQSSACASSAMLARSIRWLSGQFISHGIQCLETLYPDGHEVTQGMNSYAYRVFVVM